MVIKRMIRRSILLLAMMLLAGICLCRDKGSSPKKVTSHYIPKILKSQGVSGRSQSNPQEIRIEVPPNQLLSEDQDAPADEAQPGSKVRLHSES